MKNEELAYEDMTPQERAAALKVRRADLEKIKAKLADTKELVKLVSDLLAKHDCQTVKSLPDDARAVLRARYRELLSKEDADAIEAYWAGGPQTDGKADRVFERILREIPVSGPVQ
jgi:hypothetical protein